MIGKAVRRKSTGQAKASLSARNQINNSRGRHRAEELSDDIRQKLFSRKALSCPQTERDCWVKVSARDMTKRVCTGQHRQTKRKRDSDKAYAETWKRSRQHGASATSKHKP